MGTGGARWARSPGLPRDCEEPHVAGRGINIYEVGPKHWRCQALSPRWRLLCRQAVSCAAKTVFAEPPDRRAQCLQHPTSRKQPDWCWGPCPRAAAVSQGSRAWGRRGGHSTPGGRFVPWRWMHVQALRPLAATQGSLTQWCGLGLGPFRQMVEGAGEGSLCLKVRGGPASPLFQTGWL